jgi:hypothetical protein
MLLVYDPLLDGVRHTRRSLSEFSASWERPNCLHAIDVFNSLSGATKLASTIDKADEGRVFRSIFMTDFFDRHLILLVGNMVEEVTSFHLSQGQAVARLPLHLSKDRLIELPSLEVCLRPLEITAKHRSHSGWPCKHPSTSHVPSTDLEDDTLTQDIGEYILVNNLIIDATL